ncbi:lipocalin family protein [Diaphorobacter aerolatus]|uniref:Outer membrane lipoprotein Blc n=1 Tax=Diaphorobacter aerolatus TaxID=1288495 RepID=A0A7H0GQ21_9BURK|nr:lipocalin family protein [Diaphorobacter aerolatus]
MLPVNDFDAPEYMGHWYEIARIDHRFERGMTSTTAQYKLLDDGTVSIVNRGFDPARGTWKQSHAKAKFLGDSSVGSLKVSFFWPFQGGYNVVYVDADYSTAVVIGDDVKYFWILSRSPDMDDATYDRLLEVGRSNGVDVRKVLRVPHGAGVR